MWRTHFTINLNIATALLQSGLSLNALTSSASAHTTVSPHGYPIEQMTLRSLGSHIINSCRVWWRGGAGQGVGIALRVTQTSPDRDNIGSIGLNSLCAIPPGQTHVLQRITNGMYGWQFTCCFKPARIWSLSNSGGGRLCFCAQIRTQNQDRKHACSAFALWLALFVHS